jgi:hypothetical protein
LVNQADCGGVSVITELNHIILAMRRQCALAMEYASNDPQMLTRLREIQFRIDTLKEVGAPTGKAIPVVQK